jgi:predicted nucleic acid-binding Zn ribbon protein
MDCPNCGTFNPEGRNTCWRCDKELPKQAPTRRRDPQKNARLWLYVAVVVLVVGTAARMCGSKLPWSTQTQPNPGGYRLGVVPVAMGAPYPGAQS